MTDTNTKLKLSFDLRRREIRRELFLKRQADRNDSDYRLHLDGKKLDAQLISEGYTLTYPTKWGRNSPSKASKNKA